VARSAAIGYRRRPCRRHLGNREPVLPREQLRLLPYRRLVSVFEQNTGYRCWWLMY